MCPSRVFCPKVRLISLPPHHASAALPAAAADSAQSGRNWLGWDERPEDIPVRDAQSWETFWCLLTFCFAYPSPAHSHTHSLSVSLSLPTDSLSLLTHTWKLCWNFKAKCFTWNLFPNVLPPLFENWAMPHSFHQIVITGRPGLGLFISGDKNQVLFVRWFKNWLFHQKILRCH